MVRDGIRGIKGNSVKGEESERELVERGRKMKVRERDLGFCGRGPGRVRERGKGNYGLGGGKEKSRV